eukprot:14761566-Alexandrium_andersonii.AAC.1
MRAGAPCGRQSAGLAATPGDARVSRPARWSPSQTASRTASSGGAAENIASSFQNAMSSAT